MRKALRTASASLVAIVLLQLAFLPMAQAATVPGREVVKAEPGPFVVLWTAHDPSGLAVAMRMGRDRKTATAWGDGYGNFGLVHVKKSHVGVGADWLSDGAMMSEVRRVIEKPSGTFPHTYNSDYTYYIRCDDYGVPAFRWRVTTVVVVDTRVLGDHLPLGVKTAYQFREGL